MEKLKRDEFKTFRHRLLVVLLLVDLALACVVSYECFKQFGWLGADVSSADERSQAR